MSVSEKTLRISSPSSKADSQLHEMLASRGAGSASRGAGPHLVELARISWSWPAFRTQLQRFGRQIADKKTWAPAKKTCARYP